jgi:hypothetical protein
MLNLCRVLTKKRVGSPKDASIAVQIVKVSLSSSSLVCHVLLPIDLFGTSPTVLDDIRTNHSVESMWRQGFSCTVQRAL